MKTLLIMRHAKSSWKSGALSDHERPLNKRGYRDALRMGEELKNRDLTPDLIISSTAERALQTAEMVAENAGYGSDIEKTHTFYHAGVDEYIEGLQTFPDNEEIVMIVGHNPGMTELLDYLTDTPEMMTTANIAVVELNIERWEDLDIETDAELLDLMRPKELQ